ncbi:hypothetical protein [Pseudoalteromonas denitrificans]|uniref:Uncharacterized protein n=1 Tax=Pseudoalteromonas denitrificans DSM 6059 TaxID=1123010 RepID=A0A1I1RVS3_9GAMM|nr:hypothetical protein [Pseudoalteromonas denitrificans]SFD38429.1 hypothetical protein SAMN02745724_04357 [Pseudoalteromonas denitrificans DSM 6059]
MKKTLLALLTLYTASAFSGDKFFANEAIQQQTPLAFALQEATFEHAHVGKH